jgi:hypothetical protein
MCYAYAVLTGIVSLYVAAALAYLCYLAIVVFFISAHAKLPVSGELEGRLDGVV